MGAQEDRARRLSCQCGHAVIWHHDERGCMYLGNSAAHRCRCRLDANDVAEVLIQGAVTAVLTEVAEVIGTEVRRFGSTQDAANGDPVTAGLVEGCRVATRIAWAAIPQEES